MVEDRRLVGQVRLASERGAARDDDRGDGRYRGNAAAICGRSGDVGMATGMWATGMWIAGKR